FGADGAFSRVRHRMQRQSMFNYSQEFLSVGYKELNIPPDVNGNYIIDKNSLHIWPRGDYMLSALPNLDGSFNAILFMPFEGENSFEKLQTKEDVKQFFQEKFRSEEHTSELQSRENLVCRLLLEKKKRK